MKIYNIQKHRSCFYCDTRHNPLPLVEVKRFRYAETVEASLFNSGVIYVLGGKLRFDLRDNPGGYAKKMDLVFLPASDRVQCRAVARSSILVMRLPGSIRLCHGFGMEDLVDKMTGIQRPENLHPLKANARLQYFCHGLANTWTDGLKCRIYHQSEITKLLTLIGAYYPEDELCRFFYTILSPDTAFSEYVRMHHLEYPSVGKLADSIHMSPQQFRRRFSAVFGQPPYGWMRREKARLIYSEICMTAKPFKEIAGDFGFGDKSHFNRFCHSLFGMGPEMIRRRNRNNH